MPFKSTKGKNAGRLVEVFQSDRTNLGQGVGGGGGSVAAPPGIALISATGGTETTVVSPTGKYYKTHTYLTAGSFTFTVSSAEPTATVNIEMVGGGGRGESGFGDGNGPGRGGGAGALTIIPSFPVTNSPGSYSVVIGGGGGNTSFSGAAVSGPTITATAGAGNVMSVGTLSVTDPTELLLVTVSSGTWNGSPNNGQPGGPAYSGYPSSATLYPSPLQAAGKGNGAGGGCPTCGPPPGAPGGMRIFYRIPAP